MDLKIEPIYDSQGIFQYQDLVFESGRLETVDQSEEIGNRLICNLSVYVTENYTNESFGVDYHNNVFGHDVTEIVTIDELKAGILGTRGVTGLKTFDLSEVSGTRTATLASQVETTEGEIELTTPISI